MTAKTLAIVCLVVACSKSEPNEGKRVPQLAPGSGEIPAALEITVTIDGAAHAPITRDLLLATKPDWTEGPRRAWRIATLVGVEPTETTLFAVTGAKDVTVELPAVSTANKLVPALQLSQRGGVVAEFVDPADPFPSFHGAGGRLGRSPEAAPRVFAVTKIDVKHR